MTIAQAISLVDRLQPNAYADDLKTRWLSELDGQIFLELHQCHAGCPESFQPYEAGETGRELLVPQPFAGELYPCFLQSRMDRENGEIARYNRSIALYNSAYLRYQNHYRRTHRPLNAGPFRLKGGERPCPSTPF